MAKEGEFSLNAVIILNVKWHCEQHMFWFWIKLTGMTGNKMDHNYYYNTSYREMLLMSDM